MRGRVLISLIMMTCIGHSSHAQAQAADEEIQISGIHVSLGMSRDTAYRLFKDAHVRVKEMHFPDRKTTDEEWRILGKCTEGPDGNDDCETIGRIRFTNQKLSFALARWGTGAQSASDVTQALYGAVQDFSRKGLGQCELNTNDYGDPDHHFQRIDMQCGQHAYITVTMVKKTTESIKIDIAEMISEGRSPLVSP
jgi:hypothetical protein